jgi:hypothetical protein
MRPSGLIAMLFTLENAVVVFVLKILSGAPVEEKRKTALLVPRTIRPFWSTAIALTSLFGESKPPDPAPPLAGYRKTLEEVPASIDPSTGSMARAVKLSPVIGVNELSIAPVLESMRLIPKAPAATTYSTPPIF